MKTTHKQKVKLARKLISPIEKKVGLSIWDSAGWNFRKKAIARRVEAIQKKAEIRRAYKLKQIHA